MKGELYKINVGVYEGQHGVAVSGDDKSCTLQVVVSAEFPREGHPHCGTEEIKYDRMHITHVLTKGPVADRVKALYADQS